MGFFSEIASEARRSYRSGTPPQPPAPEGPEQQGLPQEAPPGPTPDVPEPEPIPPKPEPTPAPEQPPAPSAHIPPPPELKLDVEKDAAPAPDDTAGRQAHEAAEAKRKAEFDAMNSAELLAASVERVAADMERLTRRNMKETVAGHIQAKCRENAAFAMLVMDPSKSMVNCFQYINRQAQAYAEQEMKDNGVQRTGVYGLDVPDGLCFQWAEDYFKDENAEEDHKNDEKFVPKPYVPASTPRKAAKSKADKKPAPAAKPKAEKPADIGMEQISLM